MASFIYRYLYACGSTMVPPEFHRWACMSMLAAAVGNRVFLEKLKRPLTPNLYVMLIGPSGCGKGQAIDQALSLAAQAPALRARILRGSLTKQRLHDILSGRQVRVGQAEVKVPPIPCPWIIAPELYNSLGAGGTIAESMIAHLTDLYTGSPVPITDGTRAWGDGVVGENFALNWLSGTTPDWLRKTLSKEAILSGFFGRVVTIEGAYAPKWQQGEHPADYDSVMKELADRLQELTRLERECHMTPEAALWRITWLSERVVPQDEMLQTAYQRDDDMVLKLGMLFSVSERSDGEVSKDHLMRGRSMLAAARRYLPSLVALAHVKTDVDGLLLVQTLIRDAKEIYHSDLLKQCSNRGMTASRLNQYIATHSQAGRIKTEKEGRKQRYIWQEVTE